MRTPHLTDFALPFAAAFPPATGVGSCATVPSSLTGAVLRDAASRRDVFEMKEASTAVTKRRASWFSLLLAGLASLLASIFCVFGIVTGYAFGLAFQARGAPDTQAIESFANQITPLLSAILLPLFALAFSFLVLRGRPESPRWHGLIIGIIAALPSLILSGQLDLLTLLSVAVTIAAGFLGAVLAKRTGSGRRKVPPE